MNLMNKLKRETIARLLVPVLLLGLLGALFLSVSNVFTPEPVPRSLYEVPREELDGTYVTVDVEWIYGCYAYTEKYRDNKATGEITQREYVIDANRYDYCALILDGSLMEQAETLLAQCDAYASGLTDEITASFTVTGRMRELPSDSLPLYHRAMGYDSLSAEDRQTVLPLYLFPVDYSANYVMLILGLVCLGIAIMLLVMAFLGRFQRQITQKVESSASGSPEVLYEQLGRMLETVPAVSGLRIGGGYILLRSGFCHYFYDASDLVWAYRQVTRHRLYGFIPIGKTFSLMLKMSDGTEKAVAMREKKVAEQLEKIMLQFPGCAVGYSEELMAMYRSNRSALRQVAAAQRGRAPQES